MDTQTYGFCGHANTKAFVAMQTLRLRVCFPIQIKPVFQRLLLLSIHTNIWVHFGIWENLSLPSPSRCTFIFFQKPFCVLIHEFSKENWRSFFFFQKACCFFSFFFLFFSSLEIFCTLGKVVTWDYTYPKEQRVGERKETIHKTLFLFFFCLVCHQLQILSNAHI